MSLLYVNEFVGLARNDQGDSVNILQIPPLASYTIVVSAGSSGGPAINPLTQYVEVSTDTTCSFRLDTAGGAGAQLTDARLAPNEKLVRRVIYQPQTRGPGAGNPILSTAYFLYTTANT